MFNRRPPMFSCIRLQKRQQCCMPNNGGETQVTNKLSFESSKDQIQYGTMCESLLVTGVSPPIFGSQHCCRFGKRMQLNMGGLRLNTLFLYVFFHHLYLYFLFFFFNFSSFSTLYFVFLYSFFFYFLLQPMLILIGLSWCHKFHLHFMALMPKIKGTFIKI